MKRVLLLSLLIAGLVSQAIAMRPDSAKRKWTLAALSSQMQPYYRQPGARPVHPVTTVSALN